MAEHESIHTTPVPEEARQTGRGDRAASQIAAAVEAAYILEAVRR